MADSVVENRASLARCYHCGNPEVAGICHYCRQAVCAQHSITVSRRLGQWLFRRFTGLGLEGTPCGPDPLTCTACRRTLWTPGAWLILGGSAISLLMLIGLGLGWVLPRLFKVNTLLTTQRAWLLGALVIGLILLAIGFLYRGRRPFLPILWRPGPGRVTETLQGQITFDAQARLQTQVVSCAGKLAWPGELDGAERQRVARYRSRFRIPATDDLTFHAGFALLKGRFSGLLNDPVVHVERHGHVLRLQGQVKEQAFLSGANTRSASQWNLAASYTIPAPSALPVRLTPHLVETSNERTLELELQWDNLAGLTDLQITELRLQAPSAWGAVVQASDNALTRLMVGSEADAARLLMWQSPPLNDEQRQARRRSFEIHCERDLDPLTTLRGQVTLTWKGALSRLEGITLFFPLGRPDTRGVVNIQSAVVADFELSLAGLHFQDVRIVPNAQNVRDRDKSEMISSREIKPDATLVTTLADAFLEAGYLVRQVIEAPPQTDSRTGARQHEWDIKGRAYHGVCAVDFHLTVSGESSRKALLTQFKLTALGLYTQPASERAIERTWKRLHGVVTKTLQTRVNKVLMIPDPQPDSLAARLRAPDFDVVLSALANRLTAPDFLEGAASPLQLLPGAPQMADDESASE